jgi:uncharacterized membrane protein
MPNLIRCLAALVLLAATCLRATEPTAALNAAQQVHDIFEAKCIDCHGPELPRPKGKFGYVLDLKRMADNPDYVVRGKPADSELYRLVFNDEMPGEDANVPALTPQEKDVVKGWIEMGAPGDLPGAKERESASTAVDAVRPAEPLFKRVFRWLGKFHPLTTHFPVALMFVAVLAETIAWHTRRDSWLLTVRFLVVLAALSGVATAGLGWVDAYFSSYNKAPGALLWWHRWLGTGTSLWSVLCAALIVTGESAEGSLNRRRFRGALIAGAALVAVSGFLGSALIYGLDHYAWR